MQKRRWEFHSLRDLHAPSLCNMAQRGSASAVLEIHLLGPFRVAVDGRTVEERHWSRRKPALLIKLLALQPHHQLHREQVMEFLWPDLEVEAAINNLHKVIHQARRALEPALQSAADSHFIFTQGQQVSLRAPGGLWVDVGEFERRAAAALKSPEVQAYVQALAVYEGDLLVEDLYEDWSAPRREQLRGQYQQLLSNTAALHERRGEHQLGIERLNELLAGDATNEEAHRQLMRLYALTGNKHQSLRQYQHCSETLRKELDAEPERATNDLRRQIINGQLAPLSASEAERSSAHDQAITSLAILPLTNASDDENAEYLSDGITESIINNLSQLPQLKVMARSTVFRYKGQPVDPQEVGARLGVRAVLTGRVSYRADTLNVQTELVDVRDGSQLWGEQYTRHASDIFEVQEEIALEIARKLQLRLSGEEKERLNKRDTGNTEAYQLYLKGRYHWNNRTVEALWKGIECFRQAIEIEPAYALAYAGISDCFAFLGDVGLTAITSREAFAKAKQAARQALKLDDALAEAHVSLAHMNMHYFEWPEAEKEFKRAIELSPNHSVAHQWYAHYLLFQGQGEAAIKEAARGLELDPLSRAANGDMGQMLFYTGQYDAGIEQYGKVLELEPNFYRIHLWLGWAYEQKRMYGEAVAEFQKARTLSDESTETLASLGCVYALAGQTDEALSILAELNEMSARKYVSPYNMALIHLSLGEKDKTFEWLDRGYQERAEWMIYLGVDPRFDGLREDSRFKELLRRIGFAPERAAARVTEMREQQSELEASYNRVAVRFAEEFYREFERKPFDRELLDGFADRLRAQGRVCEIGCGPGQVARYLKDRGVDVYGVDLSSGQIECARRLNPDMTFERGDMLALDAPALSLAGVVSFYTIIHLRREDVPRALEEIHRVLRPGGLLLLSFHGGEGTLRKDEWYGEPVSIDVTLFKPEEMASYLKASGFEVERVVEREPYEFEYPTPRIYAFGRKPSGAES